MMSEQDLAEAPEGGAEPLEPSAQPDPAPSAEDRALQMGWTPKEQFKGDPAKWVDAETFVKRGDEFLPFLKANNKRQEREIAKLREAVSKAIEHSSKAEARAYERAKRDLEAELERATEAGDVAGVKAVTQEIVDLAKDIAKPTSTHPNGWTPDFAEAVEEWKEDNAWYGKDRVMTAFAHDVERELLDEGVPDKKRLKRIAKAVREEFPDKFTNPRRAMPAAAEAPGLGRAPAAKGYNDLPADARQFCDELVRDKITSREKYVADYFKDAK